jgi:hypothetical protein
VLILIKRNLHQSSAGIGSKLNTQRFIDIIAAMIKINATHASRELATRWTIQIGHFILDTASVLSSGVLGENIFCISVARTFSVSKD